ncbi:ammonium transporter [Spirochaetia bacterium 38H-sp]|uniref:Ammonium transporter n=1 Tax=Rarispira pelagica TaxID=3141764 RepID=A0ABU9UCT3_9SPIR
METSVQSLTSAGNVLFILLGAVMILAMHGGFAFLEAGTVSKKNQVNAFQKILFDWSVTTLIYFFIGYVVAYGISLYSDTKLLTYDHGYEMVKFFFLTAFAAAVPAIISGGVVGRIKFFAQTIAAIFIAAIIYPFFEGLIWGRISFFQNWLTNIFGNSLHDFAGSVVVHSIGGWLALAGILILGPRRGRYDGTLDIRPSNIPFLALGSWILIVGWFGFNVMSAQKLTEISGLVAINSLFAMTAGAIGGLLFSKNDAGFTHNGALAGLVAICAGSDVVHPISAIIIGLVASFIFVKLFHWETEVLKIDDVLGVWPLHGINGTWGGIAAGIFGHKALGAVKELSLGAQIVGSLAAVLYALFLGFILYKIIDLIYGLRMSEQEQMIGSDLTYHRIEANPEETL